jgi:DNA-binding response OmpR family regulator
MRKILEREVVDLILLDVKLPVEDGMTLTRELRARSAIPIIMLTSAKTTSIASGIGARGGRLSDQTFNPRELLARIRAVLRRTRHSDPRVRCGEFPGLRFANWVLDLRTRRLTSADGERIELTHAEFDCSTPSTAPSAHPDAGAIAGFEPWS